MIPNSGTRVLAIIFTFRSKTAGNTASGRSKAAAPMACAQPALSYRAAVQLPGTRGPHGRATGGAGRQLCDQRGAIDHHDEPDKAPHALGIQRQSFNEV